MKYCCSMVCVCGVVCLVQTVNDLIVLSGSWMKRLYVRFDGCLCWIYEGVTELASAFVNIVCFDIWNKVFDGVLMMLSMYECHNDKMLFCVLDAQKCGWVICERDNHMLYEWKHFAFRFYFLRTLQSLCILEGCWRVFETGFVLCSLTV